jgi:hypothetical protein
MDRHTAHWKSYPRQLASRTLRSTRGIVDQVNRRADSLGEGRPCALRASCANSQCVELRNSPLFRRPSVWRRQKSKRLSVPSFGALTRRMANLKSQMLIHRDLSTDSSKCHSPKNLPFVDEWRRALNSPTWVLKCPGVQLCYLLVALASTTDQEQLRPAGNWHWD